MLETMKRLIKFMWHTETHVNLNAKRINEPITHGDNKRLNVKESQLNFFFVSRVDTKFIKKLALICLEHFTNVLSCLIEF